MSDTPHQSFQVNRLVEKIRRYIPLDAGADQLVHELVDPDLAVNVSTKAEISLLAAVKDVRISLILLTGDAGHGKTRLCCELLEQLGYDPREAADAVRRLADGHNDLVHVAARQLRIVKDLSDVSPDEGATLVSEALAAPDRVTVMCVNEGRLRDIVSRRPDSLGLLLQQLERGLKGSAGASGGVLILNLNFQSVAAADGSLVEGLLREWVGDGRRWSKCTTCRAQGLCPIFENRRLLNDDARSKHRTTRWAELLRLAERTGVVVTVREMLVTVAFALTSGLRCEEVHDLVEEKPVDRTWQWPYLFSEALFEGISRLEVSSPGLRLPGAMRRLDPGRFAERHIDESLSPVESDSSFRPLDPTGDVIGIDWRDVSPTLAREEQLRLTRYLRRRAFFEGAEPAAAPRVGLRFGHDFELAVGESTTPREVRDRVVRGLAAVQGLSQTGQRQNSLPIVEPALAGRNSGVAILDRDIRLADVKVLALSAVWESVSHQAPELLEQVDWLERMVAVLIEGTAVIEMDLRDFELVCAAGEGLDLSAADPGVARRLLLQLAALAGKSPDSERFDIIEPGQRWKVDLDVDDQLIGTKA